MMQRRPTSKRPRLGRNGWALLLILALLGVSIWVMTPSGSSVLHREKGDLGLRLGLDLKGGVLLAYRADLSGIDDPSGVLSGTIDVIGNRINALGVSEPVIRTQGKDLIIVELAGITDIEEAKNLVGSTAVLEFRKKDSEGIWVPATGTITTDNGETETRVLSSRYFKTNTHVTFDQTTNAPYLNFEWDSEGAQLSKQVTTELLNKQLGIFLGDEPLLGDDGNPIAPVVNAVITDKGVVEGLSYKEASKLSNILNAGRIDVPLVPEYEKPVSATLGETFTQDAFQAGWVGLLVVALFMILYYRLPGVVSALALVIYVVIVLAIYKAIPVTLTLAGIAGFIVSLGMAVDANVLIFERMKEELRAGRTLKAAIEAGFNRAWPAIRDSNVTTFIACGILYWFGGSIVASSAVKGFAATLFIGVAISMFGALMVSRTFLQLLLTGTWATKRLGWFGVGAKSGVEAKADV